MASNKKVGVTLQWQKLRVYDLVEVVGADDDIFGTAEAEDDVFGDDNTTTATTDNDDLDF